MPTPFKVNSPITTNVNFVDVQNNLAPGTHVFQLEVVDEAGNRSKPAQARVVVLQGTGGTGTTGGTGVIGGTVITGGGSVIPPIVNPGP